MKRIADARDNSKRLAKGFTLVELLVVVSIIALLIAILLPSLKKARAQAKDVLCKSNLHSIGLAFTMYAEKYDNVWPAAVDTLENQNRWPVPFFDGQIIKDELAVYDENGNKIKGGGSTIFLCPSEKADRKVWWRNQAWVDRVEIGGSYAISEEIHRKGENGIDRGSSSNPIAPPYFRKIDNCRRPGLVIALGDNYTPIKLVGDYGWRFNRDDYWMGFRSRDGSPLEAIPRYERFRRFGDRHSGRANMLMIDTHVEDSKPDGITYNQVSWTTWTGDPKDIPGGK